MRWPLATLAFAAFRFSTTLMGAAGGAALVAVIFLSTRTPSPEWANWLAPVRQTALALAIPFLASSIAAGFLVPPHREWVRFRSHSEAPVPGLAIVLLVILGIASALQIPLLLAWWDESQRLVNQMMPEGRDPMGLWIIPASLVTAMPFLATLVVCLGALTSVAGFAVSSRAARRVVWGGAVLLCGLIVGSSLALTLIRDLADRVLALIASGPDAAITASLQEIVTRQENFSTTLLGRFHWLLGGYLLAAWATARRSPVMQRAGAASPAGAAQADQFHVPAPSAMVPNRAPSNVSALFDAPGYRLRLRSSWLLAAMRFGHGDYEISPLPPGLGQKRFFFSGRDGALSCEPNGPVVVSVRAMGGSLPLKRAYAIAEGASGEVFGLLEREGADWAVLDKFRRPVARVEVADTRTGYVRYRVLIEDEEVGQISWALHGLGVWTAEMDIEFQERASGQLERVYVVAIAPILESQARRKSQWLGS